MKRNSILMGVCFVLCIVMAGCGCGDVPASASPTVVAATDEVSVLPTAAPVSPLPESPIPGPGDASRVRWVADGKVEPGEYKNQTEAAGVTLHWMNDGEYLYVAVGAQTGGWVSVGFDPESRMQGANYVFGYVQDDVAYVVDMFGTQPAGFGSHPPDEELGGTNDVLEYGGAEVRGVTVIEFKMVLDSGDAYDKPLRAGGTYTVLLAQGAGDDVNSVHSSRGSSEITLELP
jgi:hypothetical protein